jgi:hypothetical protein
MSTYSRLVIVILEHWRFLSLGHQGLQDPCLEKWPGIPLPVSLLHTLYLIRDPSVDLTFGHIKSLLPMSRPGLGIILKAASFILPLKVWPPRPRPGRVLSGEDLGQQVTSPP